MKNGHTNSGKVEHNEPIDVDEVFATLDKMRSSGEVTQCLRSQHEFLFRRSDSYPEGLERVERDGTVTVGRFANGEFYPLDKAQS